MSDRTIVYDLRCLQDEKRFHGIGRYARGLIRDVQVNLQKFPGGVEYCFYDFLGRLKVRPLPKNAEPETLVPNSPVIEHLCLNPKVRRKYGQLKFKALARKDTLVHFLDQTNCPYQFKGKGVITVHDVIPTQPGPWVPNEADRLNETRYYSGILGWASHLVTDSDHSKKVILDQFQIPVEKITTLYPPLKFEFVDSIPATKARSSQFLFVGGLDRRKNSDHAIVAFDRFVQRSGNSYRLLIVGESTSEEKGRIEELLQTVKNRNQIVIQEYVSDTELRRLMDESRCMVFVSHYEGFGYPPLEAMSRGLPVICSKNSSLPEVAGDAALYVDSNDVESIERAMIAMAKASDEEMRQMREKGFAQVRKMGHQPGVETLLNIYRNVLI
jgi:glycosyltransferase involved in cell wall biosynthesis